MQNDEINDSKINILLTTIQNRISAMSHLHELLYQKDTITFVDANEYFEKIIFMSAYCDDETLDKAAKIEPFAYLVKPFNRNDLKSSMNIATYKLQKRSEKIDENGKYKLSHEYYYSLEPYLKVYFKNQEIDLTKNERLFLEILIKAKGEVVRFSEIENFIWFDRQISDSTLRTLMHRTTSKFNHKIIKSVSSIGYKINFS
ncbi:winged helix-turn-helix domain-containing protein [Aliarcobacter cryaerophilus]